MSQRRILAPFMTAAAVLSMAGCKVVSDPPKAPIVQDVEFLRGCWVAKTAPGGEVTGFLRLLPEGADGLAYQGYVQEIAGNQQSTTMHMSFVRDGSSMTMRSTRGGPVLPLDASGGVSRRFAPAPQSIASKFRVADHRVTYAAYPGRDDLAWIVAEGDGETLAVYVMGSGGEPEDDLFRGERDGCD